jgi:hypothetical protein
VKLWKTLDIGNETAIVAKLSGGGATKPMKVIEDKVTVYPPHSICKADIPLIEQILPQLGRRKIWLDK